MSFTSLVKNEVSKLDINKVEKIAELSAIIKTIGEIDDVIKITTENASVARRIFSLLKDLYFIRAKITVRKGFNFQGGFHYILEITNKVDFILKDLSLDNNLPSHYIIADHEMKKAYLRGLFMAIGSVNDPKKSRYHLEFSVLDYEFASFINNLLNEYFLNSKVLNRENKYMIYIKEASKISDFLILIGSNSSVLYYEDIRIYRDHKNMINRLNNCEQANVDKTILSSMEQINDINLLKKKGKLDLIDEKLKVVVAYRLKYPESSLNELSKIISLETGVKISKSGIYHRLSKIKEMAQNLTD